MRKRTLCFAVALLIAIVIGLIIRPSFLEEELSETELSTPVEIAECVVVEKKPESIEKATAILTTNISIPDRSFSDALQKETETKAFKFANTNFPMTFVDGDWSEELKTLVQEDMNLIFSHLTNYEIIKDPFPPDAYQLNGQELVSSNYILFKGRGRIFPDEYNDEIGHLVHQNGKPHLVVSDALLSAYEKALEYKHDNRVMFEKLTEFIAILNDPEAVDRISKNARLSQDMFYFYQQERPRGEHFPYQQNLQEVNEISIRMPSILSFDEQDHDGEKIIITSTLMRSKEDPDFFTDFPPFCYVNNKWYVCVPRTP